jgi:hypothetical protein
MFESALRMPSRRRRCAVGASRDRQMHRARWSRTLRCAHACLALVALELYLYLSGVVEQLAQALDVYCFDITSKPSRTRNDNDSVTRSMLCSRQHSWQLTLPRDIVDVLNKSLCCNSEHHVQPCAAPRTETAKLRAALWHFFFAAKSHDECESQEKTRAHNQLVWHHQRSSSTPSHRGDVLTRTSCGTSVAG